MKRKVVNIALATLPKNSSPYNQWILFKHSGFVCSVRAMRSSGQPHKSIETAAFSSGPNMMRKARPMTKSTTQRRTTTQKRAGSPIMKPVNMLASFSRIGVRNSLMSRTTRARRRARKMSTKRAAPVSPKPGAPTKARIERPTSKSDKIVMNKSMMFQTRLAPKKYPRHPNLNNLTVTSSTKTATQQISRASHMTSPGQRSMLMPRHMMLKTTVPPTRAVSASYASWPLLFSRQVSALSSWEPLPCELVASSMTSSRVTVRRTPMSQSTSSRQPCATPVRNSGFRRISARCRMSMRP
mmetsp:Transcript_18684/g.37593  ORF Transcript_18684/g.37593 Transcript_18684/m.37593 type:complete len:297 (-) Transcript_18684:268-1158(-)